MNKLKYTAYVVVTAFAVFGATQLEFRSPVARKQMLQEVNAPVPLPVFQLTSTIDQQEEYENLMVKLAGDYEY